MNCGKPLTYHGKFNNDLAIKYPEDELDIKFISKQSEDFCVAYFYTILDLYKDKTRQSKKMTLKAFWARDVMKKSLVINVRENSANWSY